METIALVTLMLIENKRWQQLGEAYPLAGGGNPAIAPSKISIVVALVKF